MADDFQEKEPISIHSARVGGDAFCLASRLLTGISIHSARVGGDCATLRPVPASSDHFNPLRPCGRRQKPLGTS